MAQDVSKLFDSLQKAVATAEKKLQARDAAQIAFTAQMESTQKAYDAAQSSATAAFAAASADFQSAADAVDALRSELKGVLDTLLPNSNPRVKVSS